jgi:hypothetical protein
MVLNILRAVWIFSLLVISAYLLYVYAGLPDWVELGERWAVSRNGFFYGVLLILALFNVLQFVMGGLFEAQPAVRTWYTGVLVFFHLFGMVALTFVSLINSLERYDYSSVGFIIAGSLALLFFWIAGYPLVQWLRKKPAGAGEIN